jgi:uncharacterized protein (TIGR00290 family)
MLKTLLSSSGGKDSIMALHELKTVGEYDVVGLLTTYNSNYGRVFMHGVRIELLREQAESLCTPLIEVGLCKDHTSADYEAAMTDVLLERKSCGVSSVAFGDIFLEDLRMYRTDRLAQRGMEAVFPLWKKDTAELARRFIGLGYKAVITCVDGYEMDEEYVGCEYDEKFLKSLPQSVDPCGENGEFHTFVYDGPLFKERIKIEKGEITSKDGRFVFCDLMPKPS